MKIKNKQQNTATKPNSDHEGKFNKLMKQRTKQSTNLIELV